MDAMTPFLIGYFPKRTVKQPDWLKAAGVVEICSVSDCISKSPKGWIDHWRHNDMWAYDTPELALGVVSDADRGDFDLYAYKLFPVVFVNGQPQPFQFPALSVTLLPETFERLGIDVVSRSNDAAFECSPLSCNHMAEKVNVNRHCLLDDTEAAFQLAATCEAEGAEPGPYHIVEVWRLVTQ